MNRSFQIVVFLYSIMIYLFFFEPDTSGLKKIKIFYYNFENTEN